MSTEEEAIDLSKYEGLMWLYKFAEKHGIDSEPDHEVGDLQFALETAWNFLSAGRQRELVDICKEEWGYEEETSEEADEHNAPGEAKEDS